MWAWTRCSSSRSAYLIKDGKIIYTDYKGTTDQQAQVILALLAKG